MRFFDFFAGIGGFRLGMEMAGHECVGHCEIDKYAQKSYEAMHRPKESEVFFDDVRAIRAADMPECECYCFGFPCQAFSMAGKRRGFDDVRGTLFFEVMRLAKERKPKLLFAENVSGLLAHEGGWTFGIIIKTMEELGYLVEWQVLNSRYYVPQNRERVFIVGHFGGASGREVFPITAYSEPTNELQGREDTPRGVTVYDDYNQKVRTDGNVGTVTPNFGSSAVRNGTKLIISNTLEARQDNNTRGTYPLENGGVLKVNGYHKF